MDDNLGYSYSWNGFIDYIGCYHKVGPIWITVGACIFAGTIISLIPQIIRIVRLRTSYGISPFFVFITSITQYLVVINVFCLHNADFYGVLQITPLRTIPRLLTFGNLFILWFCYLPIGLLYLIFFDRNPRKNRDHQAFRREWKIGIITISSLIITSILTFILYVIFGYVTGYSSDLIIYYGKVLGTASSILTVVQYLPQFITTCKIKDNGSLSLVTLAIQAPGGTINAIFMMVGNSESWTTFLSTFSSAVQQWSLLFLCIYYKCKQKQIKSQEQNLLSTTPLKSSGKPYYD